MRFNSLAFVMPGLIVTSSLAVAQATKSLTGTVSDAMCGRTHMMKGESAAQCTRECVKSGSNYALVVGDKVHTLKGDKTAIDKFAGANIIVKGKLSGSTLTMEFSTREIVAGVRSLGLTLHVQPICPLKGFGSKLVANSADFAGLADFSGF